MSILSTSSKLVRVGDSYSAGEGISIDNNVISVTGDYGHVYSAGENISISDDNVISSKDWSSDIDTAAQNVSAETTAWVDSQNYLTDADMNYYALITDLETTSGLLKMDIDAVSASISGKMDSTAFNDWQNGQYSNDIAGLSNDIGTVSGAVDAISGAVSSLDIPTHQEIIDASGYAYSQSTAWTDSQGYLKEHQPISADEWNSSYETVLANSAQWSENTGDEEVNNAVYNNSAKWNDIEVYQTNSSTYLTEHQSLDGYLTKSSADTLYQPIGSYATQTDLENVSGDITALIPDVSNFITNASAEVTYQPIGQYASASDITGFATKTELETTSGEIVGLIPSTAGLATTADLVQVSGDITGLIPTDYYTTSNPSGFITNASAETTYQPIGQYASATDITGFALQSDLESTSATITGMIPSTAGLATETDLQIVSGGLDYVSGALTGYQPVGSYATTGELDTASSFLSGAIDYISGVAITSTAGLATTGDLVQVSGNITGMIPSTAGLATEQLVQDTSATITGMIPSTAGLMQESELELSDNKITGYNGTAFAGQGGGSVETIPVAVISPLVTGFSGESAYLGIESTALNLSSYVPVSAIGVNSQGYVSGISGMNISAYYSRNALTANYAYTADRAYHDRNNNEITSYYQPKLTITGDAGTITSINGSAVGASIPEGWELVAGTGIEIVDDAENNQTTISVTAAGGNPEVESYVQTNSASIDDAVSTYQSNSSTYLTSETDWTNTITAASSYAYSEATAQIPTDYYTTANPSGFITNVSAENTYQTIAGMTAYQPVGSYATTGELDTASSFLSGAIDYVSGALTGYLTTGQYETDSANWEDATTAYQTNSASYLTSHQAISAEEWNSNYDTVNSNSSTWTNGGFTGEVYGISGVSPNVDVYIDQQTLWISAGGFASTGDVDYLSGVIGDVETLLASL